MSFAKFFAKATNWTPVGKNVCIKFDDVLDLQLKDHPCHGRVVTLWTDRAAVIDLSEPIVVDQESITRVGANSRHRGYDFYRLRLTAIAVNVFRLKNGVVTVGDTFHEDIVGTALVRLS